MTVGGLGGFDPIKGHGPSAAEPTNETPTSEWPLPTAEEVSDFETAALEQAVDMFQQQLGAEYAPIEPLAVNWPEQPGGFSDGSPPHVGPPHQRP